MRCSIKQHNWISHDGRRRLEAMHAWTASFVITITTNSMVDGMHLLLLALSQDGPSEICSLPSEICSLPRWWWPLCSLCLLDFVGRGEEKEGRASHMSSEKQKVSFVSEEQRIPGWHAKLLQEQILDEMRLWLNFGRQAKNPPLHCFWGGVRPNGEDVCSFRIHTGY